MSQPERPASSEPLHPQPPSPAPAAAKKRSSSDLVLRLGTAAVLVPGVLWLIAAGPGFVLLAVVGTWLASVAWSGAVPRWRTSLTAPWIAFLLAMLVAAALSVHRLNALHMVGRMVLASAVYLVAVNGIITPARRRVMMAVIALAGALAALLVVLEFLGVGPVLRWLRLEEPPRFDDLPRPVDFED